MHGQTRVDPWWAALTVWGVVNAVNVLQMGQPMFRMDRKLWLAAVATTVLLLGLMGVAMQKSAG